MTKISLMLSVGSIAAALTAPAAAQNLPAGKNKEMVEKICTGCHELSLVTDRGRSKDDWTAVVKSMIDMGADIKADQVTPVADYLASALPPRQGAAAPTVSGTATASFKEWKLPTQAFPH